MRYEGVLTKMQTEFGNPIQYYLVFEDSFLNVNQLLDKNLEINFVGYQCLNCKKKKKIIPSGILLRLFLFECGSRGLDHETGVEHCSSGDSGQRFSI